MKRVFTYCLILITLMASTASFSLEIKQINLAVFDNPEIGSNESTLSEDAKTPYTEGIDTAIYVAKQKGITITKKEFFYGNNLLNILQQAPNVRSWNPDVIMGLYSSNADLMSNSLFTDQLVLSISASDVNVSKLPANFYSLGTPDLTAAKQIVHFINKQYPNRNLFLIIGADSKESVDFANLITNLYKRNNPKQTVIANKFLTDDTSTMDISSLLKGYKPGDIIMLFAISGAYSIELGLMNKISNYLFPNEPIFISSADNWGNKMVKQPIQENKNLYPAYRYEGLYIDKKNNAYKNFAKYFYKIHHHQPVDNISFITYQTVMSVVTALTDFPPPKGLTSKQAILWSYQKALKYDPDWFRFKPNVMYKIENNQEVYYTSLPENTELK